MTEKIRLTILTVEEQAGSFFNSYWRVPMDLITTDAGTFVADPNFDDFRGSEGERMEVYHYSSGTTEYCWLSRTPEQKV